MIATRYSWGFVSVGTPMRMSYSSLVNAPGGRASPYAHGIGQRVGRVVTTRSIVLRARPDPDPAVAAAWHRRAGTGG
ncbi:uncharacterized protein RMCT_4314 [Mycolicibacterium thermoresistibile]|uniref:Uncharacterized protein n=1 Tax=Mycolicibacterium thermoresistibile TaxID=1797 RepID=A0A100XIN9_MYCTH|nr:uncharacterized protein RMCT_4314 [Mycolicibacterium thermoresistibile]